MGNLLKFILNQTEISTALPPGTLLLDFIRYHQHLTGTKVGCREGDCGACTVLVGECKNGQLNYTSATSCLMAIGNAAGKHIVTIEGINVAGLNAIQQAFADEGATQCGFCTPGFIVSLAGFCMSEKAPVYEKAIASMDGNICRCTGYKSIERAAASIHEKLLDRNDQDALSFAVNHNFIPGYFLSIKDQLQNLQQPANGKSQIENGKKRLGGGTDLYVQQPEAMVMEQIEFLFDKQEFKGIRQLDNTCSMGASVTATDISNSPVFQKYFPALDDYIKLVSSTPIRNMATLAGNFCNASPIGDFTIFFLALNARLSLKANENTRQVALRDFYKGYKQLDKTPEEFIEQIAFELPAPTSFFNFEKVCKRTQLDIASVNTAICLSFEADHIVSAGLSAGGVGPVPLFLKKSSAFLAGKKISERLLDELLPLIQSEISPISDTRGSAEYKRLLLQQLVKAHFLKAKARMTL